MSNNINNRKSFTSISKIGEFGLIGFILFILSIIFLPSKKKFISFKNFCLFYFLIFILIFDFSLHIPIIQLLFLLLLCVIDKEKNYSKNVFNN